MKSRKLRKRDWIMVLAIGAVVGIWSIMDDIRGDGAGRGEDMGVGLAPGLGWSEGAGAGGDAPALRGTQARAPAPRGGGRAAIPDGVTRFGSSVVVDATGFGQPVEAVSVLVPEGWRFQSRVTWTGEGGFCSGEHAGVFWRVESPDGGRAVASFPAFLISNWPDPFQSMGLAPRGHCHLGSIESPRQMAESVLVPALLPGNRIESVEEIRDIPDQLRQMAASGAQLEAMVGARTTPGGLLVTTRSPDGRYEEAILVYFFVTDHAQMAPMLPPQRMIMTTPPSVFRAPVGEVESFMPVAVTILATVRYNPGWQRAIQELDQRLTDIAVQGAADRSRILAQSAREVGEIQMSGWKNRMDADARGMEAVTSALAGLSQRIDPHTGQQVGLDASGVRFFANPHGEYLVVQAVDVDPRRLFPSENWQEMGSATAPRR